MQLPGNNQRIPWDRGTLWSDEGSGSDAVPLSGMGSTRLVSRFHSNHPILSAG